MPSRRPLACSVYSVVLIWWLLVLAFALLAERAQTASPPPPNILFFLADDISTTEAGCYGAKDFHTPNLDALAQGGVKFETCYATPLCQPSRVELMTGRYAFRTGYYHNWGAPRRPLVPDHITVAQLLQQAGYKTFITGKWHHAGVPSTYGFDESCITWGMDPKKWITDGSRYEGDPKRSDGYDLALWHPRVVINDHHFLPTKRQDYGPDICADQTIDFMSRNRAHSFAAFFFTTLVHTPFHPTPDSFKPGMDKSRNDHELNFKPGVQYTDKLLGRLVAALDKLGLRGRTIVFYSGDNGTPPAKGHAIEEGCHVPMVVNCPGLIPQIGSSRELIDYTDLLPTFAELAGAKLPLNYVLDGHSFAPLLLGKPFTGREWIYSPLADKRVLRSNRWLYEGEARFFDCGEHRDGDGYREITGSQRPEDLAARQRFENILSRLPLPGTNGAPDMNRADYAENKRTVLSRIKHYTIVAYPGMKRPPSWFAEKYPKWFPDYPRKQEATGMK